ncbi:MAG: hypothetical protein H6R15_1979 [Proteobacteria bacterium]|nr:hypothetical protein [Pseudomonadota bacterium]
MPISQSRRLAVGLAASLLLHGSFLTFPSRPAPPHSGAGPRLSLYLRPEARPPAAPGRHEPSGKTRGEPLIAARPLAIPAPSAEYPSPITPAPQRPGDGASRLEQAKSALAEESRQRLRDPMFAPAARKEAPPSPLVRATARPEPGEKMLGDGILQLTTAEGKVHCLQRPPEAASRDIPGGTWAIPVTCPF